ncbi:MAG: hypothetical protein ACREBG_21485 [Pyrinomonadaceae bacterium]
MKIQLRNVAILGLFFVLAIASAQAQTSRREVNIPFDFSAGSAKLKAGVYTVKRMSGNALAIRSAAGKTTALVNAPLTLGSRDSKAGQRLVFNKYGDRYFLSQIWLRVDTGRQLFPTAEETRTARDYRLADGTAKPERREVALRTR